MMLGHPSLEMEHLRQCPLCGSEVLKTVRQARRVYGARHEMPKFTVSQCLQCGLAFTNPRPTPQSIKLFYEDYFDGYMKADSAIYTDRAREVVQLVDIKKGCALDIGCGTGSFLVELQRLGWEVAGIEPDPVACELARTQHALDVHLGTLDSAKLEVAQFDVVTLWHVLEHIRQPTDHLRICHDLLKPGGWLVVEVPNFGSLQSRVFRNVWYALSLPEHLYHFSSSTLRRVLPASMSWRYHRGFIGRDGVQAFGFF
jgi:2-polyprenyl-3-methyl-5-hydroxy-6-metoxy-1,4-benzoquinol methylase